MHEFFLNQEPDKKIQFVLVVQPQRSIISHFLVDLKEIYDNCKTNLNHADRMISAEFTK